MHQEEIMKSPVSTFFCLSRIKCLLWGKWFFYACLSMSSITEQQIAVLKSLSIERLSSSDINLRLVEGFSNPKSDSLTNKIRSDAFEEDEQGTVAYYAFAVENNNITAIALYYKDDTPYQPYDADNDRRISAKLAHGLLP